MVQKAMSPLGVYLESLPKHLAGVVYPPAGTLTSLDWEDGTPIVASGTAGKIEEAALDVNDFVTDANTLLGITAAPFDGSLSAAGSVPKRITEVPVHLLTRGVVVVGNIYYDGALGSEETIAAADLLATCVLRKLSSGLYVFDKETTPSSMATFTIVRLLDVVGTIYGRIMAVPADSYLAL